VADTVVNAPVEAVVAPMVVPLIVPPVIVTDENVPLAAALEAIVCTLPEPSL
jgi:hypothetical protein